MEKQLPNLQAMQRSIAEKLDYNTKRIKDANNFILGEELVKTPNDEERPTTTEISILMLDDNILSVSDFYANKAKPEDAIGVLVRTPLISFVVAPDEFKYQFNEDGKKVYVKEYTEAGAYMLTDGHDSTRHLVEAQSNEGMTAAKLAWNYSRHNLQWHLPCMLQLATMYVNKNEINECLKAIAGIPLSTGAQWTSAEFCADHAWAFGFSNGGSYSYHKHFAYFVRPAITYPHL